MNGWIYWGAAVFTLLGGMGIGLGLAALFDRLRPRPVSIIGSHAALAAAHQVPRGRDLRWDDTMEVLASGFEAGQQSARNREPWRMTDPPPMPELHHDVEVQVPGHHENPAIWVSPDSAEQLSSGGGV